MTSMDAQHADSVSAGAPGIAGLPRPVELVCFALCVANVAYLAASFAFGHWLFDPDGSLAASDFVNVWAAGRLALDGHAAAVYDWAVHKQAEAAALGHDFDGHYAWFYPPTFLFAAAALAALPYIPAFLAWMALTFPAYLVTIRLILGDRVGFFLACACPAVLANVLVGQNGFLTAALLGGALVAMERRPVLAGCLLGLLTYKPHLGLLIPLALIAGGYWRVVWSAAAVGLALAAAALLVFGAEAWQGFLQGLPAMAQSTFTQGRADWSKLQSVFGLVRTLGGGDGLAWSLQGGVIAVSAILVCAVWRSHTEFALKAAALATAALLATPYLYLYDLVALAVPMAFLIRAGRVNTAEWTALGVASLLVIVYPFVQVAVGLLALLVVARLIARRVRPGRTWAAAPMSA